MEPRSNGKSLTACLLVGGLPTIDPIFVATLAPCATFARAVWERCPPAAQLQPAFAWAAGATTSWASVRGPLGVVVMSLRRIGYIPNALDQILRPSGGALNLLEVSP
eukprot:5656978-Pyramimonas_sp.AAC.1